MEYVNNIQQAFKIVKFYNFAATGWRVIDDMRIH